MRSCSPFGEWPTFFLRAVEFDTFRGEPNPVRGRFMMREQHQPVRFEAQLAIGVILRRVEYNLG